MKKLKTYKKPDILSKITYCIGMLETSSEAEVDNANDVFFEDITW